MNSYLEPSHACYSEVPLIFYGMYFQLSAARALQALCINFNNFIKFLRILLFSNISKPTECEME